MRSRKRRRAAPGPLARKGYRGATPNAPRGSGAARLEELRASGFSPAEARAELLKERTHDRTTDDLRARLALQKSEELGRPVDVSSLQIVYSKPRATVARLDLDDDAFREALEAYSAPPQVKAAIMLERAKAIEARTASIERVLRKLRRPTPSKATIRRARELGLEVPS